MVNNTLIYQTEDGGLRTNVTLQDDTVWLTQKQIAELFNKDIRTVNEHIQNIFSEKELSQKSTIRNFRIVRQEGARQVARNIEHYNLDIIISVGYRVKSKEGTRFRIWANKILKDYLMQGYALDQKRLKQHINQFQELQKTIGLFQNAESKTIDKSEASGLLNVLINYTHSFILLNQYDTGNFPEEGLNTNITVELTLPNATLAIQELKERLIIQNEATELFGRPKDESFAGILGNIVQSFGGEYLYPLLLISVKNGGITLLVAQSDPAQKETMIKLIINLIKDA